MYQSWGGGMELKNSLQIDLYTYMKITYMAMKLLMCDVPLQVLSMTVDRGS